MGRLRVHEDLAPTLTNQLTALVLDGRRGRGDVIRTKGDRVDALASGRQGFAHGRFGTERRDQFDEGSAGQVEERLTNAKGFVLVGPIQRKAKGVSVGRDACIDIFDPDHDVMNAGDCHVYLSRH